MNRITLIPALLLCLSACGGGGSSSTSSTGSGNTTSMPVPLFSGTRSQGVLDFATAVGYAQQAGSAVQLVQQNGLNFEQPLPPKNYSETESGSVGGTLVIAGTIAADGAGVITQTYSNYASSDAPGVVQNGRFIISQNKGPASSGFLGFSDYTETLGGNTFRFDGTITYAYGNSSGKLVGNVSVSSGPFQVLMSDLTVNIDDAIANVSASGRLYVTDAGYVDISTPTTLWYGGDNVVGSFADVFPAAGGGNGEMQLKGANGAVLHIQPLDDYLAYVGLDTDGDGKIDYGARVDRTTGEIDAVQPTGTTVAALTELPDAVSATSPVTVDGRFSYTPNGFVSYSWKLLVSPPGSAVPVSGTEPTVNFTPDVPGSYIVQLTATSDGQSAIDTQTINAIDTPNLPGPFDLSGSPATSFKIPGFIDGSLNAPVTLDGRASVLARNIAANQGNIWVLHTPPGSHATLADSTAVMTSFTPDVPGVYYATLGSLVGSEFVPSYFSPGAVSIIGVGEPLRFAAPAIFTGYTNYSVMASGTFTAGGKPGVVVGVASDLSHPNGYALTLQPGSAGYFDAPGTITFGSGTFSGVTSTPELVTADLDGDGVSDLITNANCDVNFQESGSSYASTSLSIGASCGYPYSVNVIQTGHINGSAAVVAVDPDYSGSGDQEFAAFVAGTGGSMAAPVYTTVDTTGGSYHVVALAMQDVDGDNEDDLVALVQNGVSTTYAVQIYHGNTNGTFTYKSTTTLSGTPGAYFPIAVGDFNDDGKTDVAVALGTTLNLLYGDGTGMISSTDTRTLGCATGFLSAIDLNQDGHLDLVVGDTGCSLSVTPYYTVIGILLSSSTGALGQEQLYPVVTDSLRDGSLVGFADGMFVDSEVDGLQDLYLRISSGIVLLPQMPASTSATITSTNPAVKKAQPQPEMGHRWLRAAATLRAPLQ